jgi:chorismate mutase
MIATMSAHVHHEDQTTTLPLGAAEVSNNLVCRGIRGATTSPSNTSEDILEVTRELVAALVFLNDLEPENIVSAIFTTTPDLNATFPALAAREFGWTEIPLLCAHEMSVPGSLTSAVRILLHVNTHRSQSEVRHVYLRDAGQLRPSWAYTNDELAQILAGVDPRTSS